MPDLPDVTAETATRPLRALSTSLSTLEGWLGERLLGRAGAEGVDPEVTGITLSSQRVQPGDLYAALPGARAHGARYAASAVAAGAVAVLTDTAGAEMCADLAAPVLVTEAPRGLLGGLAARVYGDPAFWRPLAAANRLANPRGLVTGQLLVLPPMQVTR